MVDCNSFSLQPDANDIYNELIMSHSLKEDITHVLVEGDSDNNFYNKFRDRKRTTFYPVCGKQLVIDTVKKLHRRKNVIGIADSDFDKLFSIQYDNKNLFFTDTHDIETLIINSPSLDYVLIEFADEILLNDFESFHGKDIRKILCESGSILGTLRLVLKKSEINVSMKDLPYEKFLDFNSLMIDTEKLVKAIFERSNKKNPDIFRIINNLNNELNCNYLCWDVCKGHELVELLLLGIQNVFGKPYHRRDNRQKLEEALRIAYNESHFKKTHLCRSIKKWERRNEPLMVFSKISCEQE